MDIGCGHKMRQRAKYKATGLLYDGGIARQNNTATNKAGNTRQHKQDRSGVLLSPCDLHSLEVCLSHFPQQLFTIPHLDGTKYPL